MLVKGDENVMKIGFIGIGAMGFPMASNVLKSGHQLYINDVNQEAVEKLVAQGAKSAISPKELAQNTDMVILMLPNTKIIELILNGDNGLIAGLKSNSCIINMSSIDPMSTKRFATLVEKLNVEWVDSPVSGGTKGAEAGSLTLMVGCKERILEDVHPILETMGKIRYVGNVGAGSGIKMVNNLLLGINMVAISEALVLGAKVGIDPEVMHEVIASSSGRSYAFEAKVPNFVLKGNFDPGFAIDLQYKDLQLAISAAKELKVPLYLGNLAQQVYESARAAGLGRKDISAVITLLEQLCDVEVRFKNLLEE